MPDLQLPCLRNEFMLAVVREHGLTAEIHGEWIVPAGRPPIPIRAVAFRAAGPTPIVLFELHAALPDGHMLIETIAGFGETEPEALAQAEAKFLAGPLHPLLSGLFERELGESITRERWQVGGVEYEAHVGAYLLFGVQFAVPPALLERIQAWIAGQPSEAAEFHWCRVFWRGGDEPVAEVLWDNESWPAAEAELPTFAWPEVDGYMSLRLFVLLRGPNRADPRAIEQVDRAIELYPDHADDDEHLAALAREMPRREAELASMFTQIAFGRALITRLFPVPPAAFVDEFTWRDGALTVEHERLSDQPHFQAGVRAAQLVEFDTLRAIGSGSAEFNALNQALHGASERGVEIDDEWFAGIQFSAPDIPRPA